MDTIRCFPPVADGNSRVLVLGSMPSVASLADGFYYAHPRNAFWRIVQELTGTDAPDPDSRRRLALRSGIAIWDTVSECEREGSLDSAIRRAVPNDISSLLAAYPGIRTVLCNGATAWNLFRRADVAGVEAYRMPSTSPAFTMPYAEKKEIWRAAFEKAGCRWAEI